MLLPEGVAHRRPVRHRRNVNDEGTVRSLESMEPREGTLHTPTAGEAAETPGNDSEPPTTGPGSGRDAWVKYAEAIGVEVSESLTRAEIIEKVQEV